MQDAGSARNRRTENGPSGTPDPTGCATGDMARYVWAGCAHWGRSNAGRGSGSGDRSAGDPVRNLFAPQLQSDEREIQKPSVFGGVLFHISFAVERNMAAGGIEKKVVGPLRPKVTRARSAEYSRRRERSERRRWRIQRGERVAAVKISSARRQAAQKFRAPQQCSFSNINRAAGPYGVRLSSCAGKCGRGAGRKKRDQDRTRCAIGVGGGESRRCHSTGTK